jgi:lambda repressor-like predicted transcriptional regulator
MTATAVAAWARKAREATAKRNEAIATMRREGASLREIAAAAGLSHTAVANILKGGARQ